MTAPVGGNELARRVVDNLIDFSGQTSVNGYMNFFKVQQISKARSFVNRMREEVQTCRNQIAQLNALIAEMEAFDDPSELVTTEEEIEMKEAQLEVMDG
ncbi:hypothetical protein Tco_0868848 [Tanacetum coccineum]